MSGNFGETVSSFLAPNQLFELERLRQAPQLAEDAHQNALLTRQHTQQQIGAADLEASSRVAQSLLDPSIYPSEESRAAAWPGLIGELQARGYALKSPTTYPGLERVKAVAMLGIPAKDQYEQGQNAATLRALAPGGTASVPSAAPGAAPLPIPARGVGGPGASVAMPPEYLEHFRRASAETGLPVDLLVAQARQESGFDPKARGGAGEIGLMQIKPSTAAQPGFGLTGVDPASLDDPGANIMFGARYLKARMGQGDPNNPADQARALASYNGGGDPNYVANVNRYRPGLAPSDPAAAVTSYVPGGDGRYQVAGGTVAPPGAAPGAAPAASGGPALVPGTDLTADQLRQLNVLAAARGTKPAEYVALQQKFAADNRAARNEARTTANQTITTNIALSGEQRAADKANREAADRALRGPSGDALPNQDRRTLLRAYDDPETVKSPEYASAYAAMATPRVTDGLQVYPDMTPFKLPQDKDGNPILSYGQPRLVIGPGDLGKYRAIEEQFSTITYTLDTLQKAWANASTFERAETLAGKPTALRTAWTNAALLAKGEGLFQLGVISGPDKVLLQGALADPSTFWGAFTSNEEAAKQIDMVKELLAQRRSAARNAYGGGMGIGGGPGGGAGGGAGGKTVLKFDAQGNIVP